MSESPAVVIDFSRPVCNSSLLRIPIVNKLLRSSKPEISSPGGTPLLQIRLAVACRCVAVALAFSWSLRRH